MSLLFEPLQLKQHILQNRIVVSPMCQYSSQDGFATNWHLVHLGQFAIGKAGLIIQEATAVSPEGRITYADLGIWKEEHIPELQKIVDFVHQQSSLIGIQLAHAGRKDSTNSPWVNRYQLSLDLVNGWQTDCRSPIPFHHKDYPPSELTVDE